LADNPFLPLSFIAGPAILTNASTVLLNGASIRYNLAVGLWRDLQSELHGRDAASAAAYPDQRKALHLANRRVVLIVRGLSLLYCAVGGFGLSTLAGLVGGLSSNSTLAEIDIAKTVTLFAGGFALLCLLFGAVFFIMESRCTIGLLDLALPRRSHNVLELPEGG
jgi:hypothetical protein